MRALTFLATTLASLTLTLALEACKEDLDCKGLCDAGQDGDCTSISGDCGDFCTSLTNIEDDANCGEAREEYQSCLNEAGVCSGDCGSEESALSSCITLYCATRLTTTDCMVLVESF